MFSYPQKKLTLMGFLGQVIVFVGQVFRRYGLHFVVLGFCFGLATESIFLAYKSYLSGSFIKVLIVTVPLLLVSFYTYLVILNIFHESTKRPTLNIFELVCWSRFGAILGSVALFSLFVVALYGLLWSLTLMVPHKASFSWLMGAFLLVVFYVKSLRLAVVFPELLFVPQTLVGAIKSSWLLTAKHGFFLLGRLLAVFFMVTVVKFVLMFLIKVLVVFALHDHATSFPLVYGTLHRVVDVSVILPIASAAALIYWQELKSFDR